MSRTLYTELLTIELLDYVYQIKDKNRYMLNSPPYCSLYCVVSGELNALV